MVEVGAARDDREAIKPGLARIPAVEDLRGLVGQRDDMVGGAEIAGFARFERAIDEFVARILQPRLDPEMAKVDQQARAIFPLDRHPDLDRQVAAAMHQSRRFSARHPIGQQPHLDQVPQLGEHLRPVVVGHVRPANAAIVEQLAILCGEIIPTGLFGADNMDAMAAFGELHAIGSDLRLPDMIGDAVVGDVQDVALGHRAAHSKTGKKRYGIQ